MAFTSNTFQFGRGILTSSTNGTGVNAVIHTYKTDDLNAAVNEPGYFPDYIDGATDKVFVGDFLGIVSGDSTTMVRIEGLAPFTYGADLFGNSGAPLVMGAPVAPTDGNGAKITGTTLQLAYATSVQPGILSAASQAIAGNKSFSNLITANGGIRFLGNTDTLEFYENRQIVLTFTNGSGNTGDTNWLVTRIGDLVAVSSIGFVTTSSQLTPGTQFVSDAPLPADLIPTSAGVFNGIATINNGSTTSAGLVNIDSTGTLRIYNNFNKTTAFTSSVTNGFVSASIIFSRS